VQVVEGRGKWRGEREIEEGGVVID